MTNPDFVPNWFSSPGDTIADVMNERGLSVQDLATGMNWSVEELQSLIDGRQSITISIARMLEKELGASVAFWMSRDFKYRMAIDRLYATDEVLKKRVKDLPAQEEN